MERHMASSFEPPAIEAVLRGDAGALGRLLESHQDRIFNTCLRMIGNYDDAAEVAQEVMLKIVEHIQSFHGQSEISTWMVRIAMNLSISHLRKRKLRQTTSLDAAYPHNAQDQSGPLRRELADHREPAPDSGVQHREMVDQLQGALSRLDDEFRAILVLRDVEGLDYQQIAHVLAMPVGTVKSRLFRARLALRQEILKLHLPTPKPAPGSSPGSTPGSIPVAPGTPAGGSPAGSARPGNGRVIREIRHG
jgi:RNA polymerase sigma-70 factor, ECF subfamily